MREFQSNFREGLLRGLRQFRNNPADTEALVQCHNVKPSSIGLIPFEPIETLGIALPTTNWPYCQLFIGSEHIVYCDGPNVYRVISGILTGILYTSSGTDWWDFIDYGAWFIMTDGNSLVYIDTITGNIIGVPNLPNIPRFRTGTNFKGQIVAGNILSVWEDYGPKHVIWSKVGYADFTLGIDNVSGMAYIPTDGEIVCVKRLGDGVAVYTTSGVWLLTPYERAFGLDKISATGLRHIRGVAGDELTHVFVDNENFLWRLRSNRELIKLDYSEFMETMVGGFDTTVSFDPTKREFYITNFDSDDGCYLLSEYGMSTVYQMPSSVAVQNGNAIGVFEELSEVRWIITTDTLKFGQTSLKTLVTTEVVGNFNPSLTYCAIGWANEFQRNRDNFEWRDYFRLNPLGQYTPKTSGAAFRISLRNEGHYYSPEMNIDEILLRVKHFDKRTIRGLYSEQ